MKRLNPVGISLLREGRIVFLYFLTDISPDEILISTLVGGISVPLGNPILLQLFPLIVPPYCSICGCAVF